MRCVKTLSSSAQNLLFPLEKLNRQNQKSKNNDKNCNHKNRNQPHLRHRCHKTSGWSRPATNQIIAGSKHNS